MRHAQDRPDSATVAHVPSGSERGAAPEALFLGEGWFRLAFENANIGICLVSPDARFLRVNAQLCTILGYSSQELEGANVSDITHPDDLDVGPAFILGALAGETPQARFQKRYIRKDGQTVWAQVTSSLVRGPNGGLLYFVTHIEDITERRRLEEAESQHRTLAEGLLESVGLVHSSLSQEEVIAKLLGIAQRVVPHTGMYVMLVDDEGTTASVAGVSPCYAQPGAARPKPGVRTVIAQEPLLRQMSLTPAPVIITDTRAKPGWLGLDPESAAWIRSLVGASMRSDGELLGFLMLESDRPGSYGEKEASRLQALADQCAVAIWHLRVTDKLKRDTALLEQRVAERTRRLEALYQVTALTGQHLDLRTMLERALQRTVEGIGCCAATIHLLDAQGEWLWLEAQTGLPAALLAGLERLPAHDALMSRLLAKEKATVVPNIAADAQAAEALGGHVLGAYVGVPVRMGGQTLGMLSLFGQRGQAVEVGDLELLASIAGHLGAAVESARLYERAEQEAVAAERQRLARDLHDAVTQTLFSVTLIAEVLPRLWQVDQAEAERNLEKLHRLTRAAQAEMRSLLMEMRPAAVLETRLSTLVRHLGEALGTRAGVSVSFSASTEMPILPPEVHLVFFRVAQEALNNVARHAQAQNVKVTMRSHGEGMELRIVDDGVGFDPNTLTPGHLGVGIMRERAAQVGAVFRLDSAPGHGTSIDLTWEPGGRFHVRSQYMLAVNESSSRSHTTPAKSR